MNILIVGTGQLGSRYLQGLAACSTILEIWCFDPSLDSLKTAKERWKSVGGSSSIHRINWTQDYSELPKIIDLAIVATNADVRSQVLKAVLQIYSILSLKLIKLNNKLLFFQVFLKCKIILITLNLKDFLIIFSKNLIEIN